MAPPGVSAGILKFYQVDPGESAHPAGDRWVRLRGRKGAFGKEYGDSGGGRS
jgi:hypothetical protein